MTDKPNKSTKANQLEALNALIDKQTAQLADIAALVNSLKAMLDTVTSINSDKKCSCKDNGCHRDVLDASDTSPEVKYTSHWADLIEQWNSIQPGKSKSNTQPEKEQKRETNEQDKKRLYQKINASHHPDFLIMLNNLDELLNKTKRKCVCDCTDDWDIIKGSESEEYDNAFTRFPLDSNNDIIVGLHVSSGDCGYTITCTLDYDDNNYSINIITDELDKDVLESLFMKITKSLDSFDADFAISDVAKIATKLYQLFDALA